MSDWLVPSLLLLALGMGAAQGAEVRCQVSDPAVEVALERLRAVLAEPPFSDLDYDLALSPPQDPATPQTMGPEGFEVQPFVRSGRTTLRVRAETPVGLARGILRLVRIGLAEPTKLATTGLRLRPAMPIREVYEEHGWDDPAALEGLRGRLRWLFEEGYNRLDIPFGWWMPPPDDLLDLSAHQRRWGPALETLRQVIAYAHDLGIEVYLVENPQFSPYYGTPAEALREPYRSQPRPLSGEAYMLCPSEPANQALARRRAEYLYRQVPTADGIVVYFGDPGGCQCDRCRPWGETMVRLCRDLYAPLLAETAPSWDMTVTTWGVPRPAVAYLVDHLAELPAVIAGLQMPPHAPSPPYLVYDAPMTRELLRAAPHRQVVMQQFLDGVGFRNGWVNLVEHPMPALMERSLRACLSEGHLAGVYSSAFDNTLQRVGTRLIGEWGLDPSRSGHEILVELGAEWFGPATGPDFAGAMEALERYWDVAYAEFFADGRPEGGADTGALADEVRAGLQRVSRQAVRGAERLRPFAILSEAMGLTSRQAEARAQAARLGEGSSEGARKLLRGAQRDARRIARLMSTEPYEMLPRTALWPEWVIERRPAVIGQELGLLQATGEWEPVTIPDADFRAHSWSTVSLGHAEWVEDPERGGCARLDNSQAEGQWSAIASPPIAVRPNAPFRLTFDVRRDGPEGLLWAQWIGPEGAELGSRMAIEAPTDGRWHEVILQGVTPETVPAPGLLIRFVLVWPAREAVLAKLELHQKPGLPGDRPK